MGVDGYTVAEGIGRTGMWGWQ